jgi:hypothetical protein
VSRNIGTLFFLLGWAQRGLNKKHPRKHYTELVFLYPVGSVGQLVAFGAFGE